MTVMRKPCDGCGTYGVHKDIHTTNGALRLCVQCLDDINRKNPELCPRRACGLGGEVSVHHGWGRGCARMASVGGS